jgi:hypothetical protein
VVKLGKKEDKSLKAKRQTVRGRGSAGRTDLTPLFSKLKVRR